MASTAVGSRLTEQHRQAQARLAGLTAVQLRDVWRLLDPDDLTGTSRAWVDNAVRVVVQQFALSSTLARRYFQAFRLAEVGARLPGVLPAPALDEAAARTSLVVTAPVRIARAQRRALPIDRAVDLALTESTRAANRHVLNGGRETILQTAAVDRRAAGYRRITSSGACQFCTMLEGRGAVYTARSGDFQAHDGCNCASEPAY